MVDYFMVYNFRKWWVGAHRRDFGYFQAKYQSYWTQYVSFINKSG